MEDNAKLMNKFLPMGNVVRVEHEGRVYRVFLNRLGIDIVKVQVFSRGYSHWRVVSSLRAREIRKLVAEAGIKYEEFKS